MVSARSSIPSVTNERKLIALLFFLISNSSSGGSFRVYQEVDVFMVIDALVGR